MSNPPASPSPVPQPKSGMPKWLIILLVILLVVMLGCCGGITTCIIIARRTVKAAPGILTSALNKEGINYDTSGNGISLPGNFPSDIPIYTGMKAKFSGALPGSNGGAVTFTGTAKPQDLSDYYTRELTAKGWTQAPTATMPSGFNIFFNKDKQSVQITGTATGSDTTMEITYGTSN